MYAVETMCAGCFCSPATAEMLSREEFSEKRKYLSYSERIILLIDESHEMLTSAWDQQKSWKDAIQDRKSSHSTYLSSSFPSTENSHWKEIKYFLVFS
jgi:hypothetical protein